MGWVESGRAWGERATDWAHLVEPYARHANDALLDRARGGPGDAAAGHCVRFGLRGRGGDWPRGGGLRGGCLRGADRDSAGPGTSAANWQRSDR